MSANVVNRVILPDGGKLYVTDDVAGDNRMEQIYTKYGNCKIEACYKDENQAAKSLDDFKPFWTGTIEEQYS